MRTRRTSSPAPHTTGTEAGQSKDERDLLAYPDALNARGIRFALSNVLESKGRRNTILAEWAAASKGRCRTLHPENSCSNSNYHTRDRSSGCGEVLIINY
ncbi:MAG: hypothetical protein LUD51_04865 [Clostridia bacterium]|nr:hypothetical protein [Clostridia bacterium]